MVDETQSAGGSAASVCPWCSATYQGSPEDCPSCGATLTGEAAADPSLPGLTAVDAAAIVRAKTPVPRQRNRILSWISGDYPDDGGSPAEAGALAPPDVDVKREILRLELEAEVANLHAEAEALKAEAVVDGRGADAVAAADSILEDIKAVETDIESAPVGTAASAVQAQPAPMDAADASESAPPA